MPWNMKRFIYLFLNPLNQSMAPVFRVRTNGFHFMGPFDPQKFRSTLHWPILHAYLGELSQLKLSFPTTFRVPSWWSTLWSFCWIWFGKKFLLLLLLRNHQRTRRGWLYRDGDPETFIVYLTTKKITGSSAGWRRLGSMPFLSHFYLLSRWVIIVFGDYVVMEPWRLKMAVIWNFDFSKLFIL